MAFQYLTLNLQERWREGFTRACSDRTRGFPLGFKMKENRFRLGIRKKFLTARVVSTGIGCLAKLFPSLAVYNARLDGVLSSLVL